MFTRVVEVNAKAGKGKELSKTIHEKALPILKDQPGFVDELVLVSDSQPDQILALSFWQEQQQADRYNRDHYPKINQLISHLIDRAPVVRTFTVETSTRHKIAAGKAA